MRNLSLTTSLFFFICLTRSTVTFERRVSSRNVVTDPSFSNGFIDLKDNRHCQKYSLRGRREVGYFEGVDQNGANDLFKEEPWVFKRVDSTNGVPKLENCRERTTKLNHRNVRHCKLRDRIDELLRWNQLESSTETTEDDWKEMKHYPINDDLDDFAVYMSSRREFDAKGMPGISVPPAQHSLSNNKNGLLVINKSAMKIGNPYNKKRKYTGRKSRESDEQVNDSIIKILVKRGDISTKGFTRERRINLSDPLVFNSSHMVSSFVYTMIPFRSPLLNLLQSDKHSKYIMIKIDPVFQPIKRLGSRLIEDPNLSLESVLCRIMDRLISRVDVSNNEILNAPKSKLIERGVSEASLNDTSRTIDSTTNKITTVR